VVPDKRFCFDYFQPLTLTADVLQAHTEKPNRHSLKAAFHGFAYPVKSGGSMAWEPGRTNPLSFAFQNSLNEGRNVWDWQSDPNSRYLDVHGWYFTPSSFRLVCLELAALNLIPFEEIGFFTTTSGCEFFVTLCKTAKPDISDLDDRRHYEAQRPDRGTGAGEIRNLRCSPVDPFLQVGGTELFRHDESGDS